MNDEANTETALVEPAVAGRKAHAGVTIVKLNSVHEAGLLLPLVRSWHADSFYNHLPFSERKYLATITKTLQRGHSGAAFYALYRGRAVGLIDIAIGEAWLSEGGCYATCLAWFVAPNLRSSMLGSRIAFSLFSAATSFAIQSGANAVFVSGTNGGMNSLAIIGVVMGPNVRVDIENVVADC